MRTRNILSALTLLTGLALGSLALAQSTTIVWAASPISNNGLRAKLIAAFEKAYPNIHVKLISQPTNTDTNRATLVTEISSGSSTPDVYMGDVIWPAQFGHDGLALPLSKYLPASFWDRFAPGLVAGATYKGQIYGAPFFLDGGFLYYRKDLLAKMHLPVPKTWAQLKQEALELKKAGLVKYGFVWQGAAYEGLTCDWMEYLSDAGGSVFNANLTKVEIDSPQALKALEFMRSLITSGASPEAVVTYQEPQAMNTFASGEAAFMRNWDYAWAASQDPQNSKVVGKVGVAPLPTFNAADWPGHSTVGGWNLYINPHSKHLKADLTFIEWMTGVQAQTIMATYASEIPSNYAVQKSPEVRAKNPVLRIVSLVKFTPRPAQTPAYPSVSAAIYRNINAALAGSVSPQQALAQAQREIESAISGKDNKQKKKRKTPKNKI
jgi:multiple sugar transport system substrate-binding protein